MNIVMNINIFLLLLLAEVVIVILLIRMPITKNITSWRIDEGEIEMNRTLMREKKEENGTIKVEIICLAFYVKYFVSSYSTCSIEQAGMNIRQLFMSSVNKIEAPRISKIWSSEENLLEVIKKNPSESFKR